MCILDNPYSKYCVGYLLLWPRQSNFLSCGDSMTSFLSPDCPKKIKKKMGKWLHREMFTCLGNLNFVTKCSSLVNHFQVTMNFFFSPCFFHPACIFNQSQWIYKCITMWFCQRRLSYVPLWRHCYFPKFVVHFWGHK